MARISDIPLLPCSSAYNPRTLPFSKAWSPEPRDWNDLVDANGTMNGFDTSFSLVGEFL